MIQKLNTKCVLRKEYAPPAPPPQSEGARLAFTFHLR